MVLMQNAITSIYDTVNNPDNWGEALDICTGFVGARSSSVIVFDRKPVFLTRLSYLSRVFRDIEGDFLRYYNDHLIQHEQDGWDYVMSQPARTLVTDKDVWKDSDEVMAQREDFAFLLKHSGVMRRVVARLNDNRAWSDNIAFQFDKSIVTVSPESMHSMSMLLPHIAKAIEMGRAFHELQSQYNAVLGALDYLEVGICIALEDGTLITRNAEARRILESKNGLAINRNGRLTATNTSEYDMHFKEAISLASATAAGNQGSVERLFSIDRKSAGHPYLVEISPLKDALGEIDCNLYGALITIVDPQMAGVIKTDALAKAYALTQAESKVVKLIAEGHSTTEIADKRNVTLNTVKTQVASILSKTNSHSRYDVIRLALKITPPIKYR